MAPLEEFSREGGLTGGGGSLTAPQVFAPALLFFSKRNLRDPRGLCEKKDRTLSLYLDLLSQRGGAV
jgi:hypothetical protein